MKRHPRSRLSLLLAALCFLVSIAVARAESPDPTGKWKGFATVTPGEYELDFEINLAKTSAGSWSGTIIFPAFSFEARPLKSVGVQGSAITLKDDTSYGLRIFDGALSPGGNQILGDYFRGELGVCPFTLERESVQAQSINPPLADLSNDARELREMFNRDAGKERLIFILSPTSVPGNIRSRMVQRHVLEMITHPNLRVYILWIPILPTDDRKAAEQATVHVPDYRVTHFWAKNLTVPQAFQSMLGVKDVPSDVFLVYPPNATWETTIPTPITLSHQLEGLPEDERFNSVKLANEVRKLLPVSQ